MELCKLAIWHSLQYADVDTNLVGVQTRKQLQMNLDVLHNGITEKEKALLQEIREKYVSQISHDEPVNVSRIHSIDIT